MFAVDNKRNKNRFLGLRFTSDLDCNQNAILYHGMFVMDRGFDIENHENSGQLTNRK